MRNRPALRKGFSELSDRGKVTRLRRGALEALRDLQLIHGDLHTWNASVSRGIVFLFDFHSFAWGFPVQDLATALAFLQQAKYFRPMDRVLAEAFLEGYAEVGLRPKHCGKQLAALVAGHFLGHMCNVMQMDPLTRDKKAQCISRTEELLRKLHGAPDVISLCQ